MNKKLEKSKSYSENKEYNKAIELLLSLEQNSEENKPLMPKILKELFKNYKVSGDLKSALEYYKKFTTEEFENMKADYKEKTENLSSTLKIHSAQKETELLQNKNIELQNANKELNFIRDKKNELIRTVSEELKMPIVTMEGISLNYYKAMKDGREVNPAEIKTDLEAIETLSQQVLKNVNSILEKSKEEYKE